MSKLKLAIGAVSGKKQLLSRIKRITNSQVVSRQFNYGQKLIALLLVTAVICSVAWLSPEEKKAMPTKALVKKTLPVPVLKAKTTSKPSQPAEAIAVEKTIEIMRGLPSKQLSKKTEPTAPDEVDLQNSEADDLNTPIASPVAESDEIDGNKDQQDLSKHKSAEYTDAMLNLSPERFSFDQKGLKLPPFISIQNFPFQNMNFRFDFSKADFEKLNQDLKLAHKKINTLTWNKIQNEIQKSFAKVKLSGSFSKKEKDAFFDVEKNTKALSRLNLMRVQQQNNSKAILEQLEKAVMDSLHTAQAALAYYGADYDRKIQENYKIIQRQHERRNAREQYCYTYSNTTPPGATAGKDEDERETTVCPRTSATPNASKKIVRISIKRTSSHTGVLSEKLPLQFSLSNDNNLEKGNQENVISIEITDAP